MSHSIMDALSSDGDFAPIFKFNNPGDSISGVIVEEPTTMPLTAFKSTEPKIGPDGKPVMQVLIVVASEQCQNEHHDGRWRVFIDKPLMKDAVRQAVRTAGAPTLELGGEVTISFTGWRELGSGQAKAFTVAYAAPDGPIGSGELGETGDAWGCDGTVA
ncbi:MAG: hypothetical protein FGM52_05130 [Mycobacterium sp.]|nr:hypothetical protein [Mycobacterium sp.]